MNNLNKLSVELRDLSVRYSKRKPADVLKDAKYLDMHRDYWYTFDCLNEEKEDVMSNGIALNKYLICKVHAGLVLPRSVRIINSKLYADFLVRPDLTFKGEGKPNILSPEEFNAMSGAYAGAALSETMEYAKTDLLLATAFGEKYFLIIDSGAVNYTEGAMPFVLKASTVEATTPFLTTSGVKFADEVEKYVLHQFASTKSNV